MPALLRKFNYRNVTLSVPDGENVGVITGNGVRYYRWMGFMEMTAGMTLVRLEIHAYSPSDGYCDRWRRIPEGEYVYGYQVAEGVYGVLVEGMPRIE